ncbi:HAD hydrolase-like protein [Patescibacteria group bacterium]|nr:HAD hydrolase-like protein [Patescibacteria group bacterium]
MIKLIIFDWNGTLFADTIAVMESNNQVLKALGCQPVNLRQYRATMKIPAIDFYGRWGADKQELLKNSKKYSKIFHHYYEPRAKKCRTRAGARELLIWFKKHSVESVILSNHTIPGINYQLKRLKIIHDISHVLANTVISNTISKRNKLERARVYLKKKKYKPSEILIIGDSAEEVEIGRKLGIITVAITHGWYSITRLKASQPDYLIANLKELIKIVKAVK